MARPNWTILLVTDDRTAVRQFRVTREIVRGGIALVLLLLAIIVSAATQAFIKFRAPRETAKIAGENAQLRTELNRINGQVEALNTTLAALSKQDEHFRLVAGLEPLNDEVLSAGIGGPDGESGRTPLWRMNALVGAEVNHTTREIAALLRRARLLSASWDEAHDTLQSKYARMGATPSILPTDGTISSAFTRMRVHPILNRARPHEGIDITAQQGTPIVASANGRVRYVGYNGEYGLMVEIDHGYGYITRYAHASTTKVRPGQQVKRGETIGQVGSTGLAVGPHLHYEVLVNGRPANPRSFLMRLDAIPD